MGKRIVAYELIDHGIDHAQYYPGYGVSHTVYEHCVTGVGENLAEAIDDVLEMIAQSHDDLAKDALEYFERDMLLSDCEQYAWPTEPNATSDLPDNEQEDSELHYYVAIRYNLA